MYDFAVNVFLLVIRNIVDEPKTKSFKFKILNIFEEEKFSDKNLKFLEIIFGLLGRFVSTKFRFKFKNEYKKSVAWQLHFLKLQLVVAVFSIT